jgi:putative transposase
MRTRRLKAHPDASSGFYHCMSRVVDRQFIFGEIEKEHFVRLMRQYARFCGIQILTFCLMGNHFHLLIEVPKRPEFPPNDAELLQRISAIYPPAHVEQIRRQLADTSLLSIQKDALRQRFWQRMGDLSQYLKELKQRFSQWHNLRQGRRGTLWEERFKSVLIGADGSALSTIAAYIDLNPVRAGLVTNPARYRWSGYGQAMAGRPEALSGYQALVTVRNGLNLIPAKAFKLYCAGLFDYAERRGVFSSTNSRNKTNNTANPSASARRPQKPYREPGLVRQLLHRISYFTDGAVIGSRNFVESIGLHHQHWLQRKRKSCPHPVSNLETPTLFSLRPSRVLAARG